MEESLINPESNQTKTFETQQNISLPSSQTPPIQTPVPTQPPPTIQPSEPKTNKKTKIFAFVLIIFLLLLLIAALIVTKTQTTEQPEITPSPEMTIIPEETPVVSATTSSSSTPLAISDKWKLWSDPNGFYVKYPPSSKINHLNELTTIERKSQSGLYIVSFCKNCNRTSCEGTCNQLKDISITIGSVTKTRQQISPSNKGYYTFQAQALYPNKYNRETLLISAEYENEDSLEEINLLLSTFDWKEKATPTPTAPPKKSPSPTPDYF